MADQTPGDAPQNPADLPAEQAAAGNAPEKSAKENAAEAALRAAQAAIASLNDDVAEVVAPAAPAAPAVAAAAPAPAAMAPLPPDAKPFNFADLAAAVGAQQAKAIDLLSDVNLNVKIELGRTRMLVEDVLRLAEGAVVELDKLAGDPVDIYVNERHIARGEVLVLNDNFCVRIHEILKDAEGKEAKAG